MESVHIAERLKESIESEFPKLGIKIWTETEWGHMGSALESLQVYIDEFYYAIFIGYPDDISLVRGQLYFSPRDNVLFEFGLFLSRLGTGRTFLLIPNNPIPFDANAISCIFKDSSKLLTEIGAIETINFKLLSDLNGLTMTRYSLVFNSSQNKWCWNNDKLSDEVNKLVGYISKEEIKFNDIINSPDWIKEHGLRIIDTARKNAKSLFAGRDTPENYYISSLVNTISDLIIARASASGNSIYNTTSDIIDLTCKIDDYLDVGQLVKKQHHNRLQKVIVFAEDPIEFDSNRNKIQKFKDLRKQIRENLLNGMEYTYIVGKDFMVRSVDLFLKAGIQDIEQYEIFEEIKETIKSEVEGMDKVEQKQYLIKKMKSKITIIKIEPLFFKTYFTLHYEAYDSESPKEVYMSALLEHRDDMLIQITYSNHLKRILSRINAVTGITNETYGIKTKHFVFGNIGEG